MNRYNEDLLDILSILSFVIGIANYNENLSQSDKDDLMHALDEKTNKMLESIKKDLDFQNRMLKKILKILEG